jgi:xanthine dehydrogenase accessory factor
MAADPPTADEIDAAARELAVRGEPYVRATVVRREPPVSANVGDRALVTAGGEIHGWIGGVECAQTAVVEEARTALETGEPRLVGLAPDPANVDRPGLVARPMTCHGGGTLEVFLEPTRAATDLLLVGSTPVADAVGRYAADLGFAVTAVATSDGDRPGTTSVIETADLETITGAFVNPPLAVVASMGESDAVGLAAAIELESPYVGLVANERRADEVIDRAASTLGIAATEIREAVTVPAGIDIDARTPVEIGVSVAAELVRVRHGEEDVGTAGLEEMDLLDPMETATDPVCGMAVDTESPAATVEHGGETYYFCSARCAESFEAAPAEHLADA